MSETKQPIGETPAASSATVEPALGTTTAENTITPAAASDAALPNVVNPVKEEKVGKGEVLITSKAINEGVLNYKGPGLK